MDRTKIAGFDFDKKVVLIKTDKIHNNEPVYEVLSLPEDEVEVLIDTWFDYRDYKKRNENAM